MEIAIGMTRAGLRKLAAEINAACDEHVSDEGIEVEIRADYNGDGPDLLIRLNNDDMEGDHIASPDVAYWESET